jgi:glycosyltransferase involved in cell wall biosynthesis
MEFSFKEEKKLVYVVNRLSEVGGGEKLLLEGVKYYRSIGYRVYIITWEFDEKALFNGVYENKDIINFNETIKPRGQVLGRAFDRIKSLFKLRKLIREINPELILTQGEYDVAILYLSTLFTNIKYTFIIFGQIFQFPHDIGKYALIFRQHLFKIRNSQQGYKETIPLEMPKVGIFNNLANEIISYVRYKAVRNAIARFVFAKSTQWETSLLFGSSSHVLKGAFPISIFKESYDLNKSRTYFNLPKDKKILLSFSRVEKKKRVDLAIKALLELDDSYVLVIAGKGSDLDRLQKLVTELNLQMRVIFMGYIKENDANKLKSCCDIFISMDIGDFDISPFEALALGKKAILPKEFDMDSNLAKFENVKFINANHKELAEAVKKSITRENDNKFHQVMEEYSWENYFQTILNFSLELHSK